MEGVDWLRGSAVTSATTLSGSFSAASFNSLERRDRTAEGNVFDLTQMSRIFLAFSCNERQLRKHVRMLECLS